LDRIFSSRISSNSIKTIIAEHCCDPRLHHPDEPLEVFKALVVETRATVKIEPKEMTWQFSFFSSP
jgi:hypothetical protein